MARRAGSEDPDLGNHLHNEPPAPLTDDQKADLLLIHLRNHRGLDAELEAAMNVVRGINKRRKRLRNDVKNDGFLLKYVDEALHDEKKAPHEISDDAANRTFIRRTVRLAVVGDDRDQIDLFEAKTSKGDVSLDGDDAFWAGRAYAVALRGDSYDPAENEVPPERIQAWEQGIAAGLEKIGKSMKSYKEIEARREPAGE